MSVLSFTNEEQNLPSPPSLLVGIGLRHPYYQEIIDQRPDIGWLEVHPENFFGGGAPRHYLARAREYYALSLHAVGLSLGSDQPVSEEHLANFKELIDEFAPFNISDHASWSASGNAHLNDLLPLPYTQETLDRLSRNIDRTQNYFGRTILLENPSTYVAFQNDEMTEYEFMNRIAENTGCGILLDVNNIYVQAHNHDYDAYEYIDNINARAVGEIHLAGHTERQIGEHSILIDTHNNYIRREVWDLYEYTIQKIGPVPSLIEWDQDFPSLEDLLNEARKARDILEKIDRKRLNHAAE